MQKTARICGPILNFKMSNDGKVTELAESNLAQAARERGYAVSDERRIVTPEDLQKIHQFMISHGNQY